MYQLQQFTAGMCRRLSAIPAVLSCPLLRFTRFVLAAALPFLLFGLALVCCLQALVPAAEQTSAAAASSLLSQPSVVTRGPGRYMHVTGRIRLLPGTGFTPSPDAPFVPIEFWYNEKTTLAWCVRTPDALAYSSSYNSSIIVKDSLSNDVITQPLISVSYSQVSFVGRLMWGKDLFPLEGNIARCRKSAVTSIYCNDAQGGPALRVTISPNPENVPPVDAVDSWFNPAYAKTYTVDSATQDLLSVRVSTAVNGKQVVLFETDTVTYTHNPNPPKPLADAIEAAIVSAGPTPRPMS